VRSVVVDTHALVWHVTAPEKVGARARKLLAAADEERTLAWVPAIALVETWLLYERGRLRFGPDVLVAKLAARAGWHVLALDVEQALEVGAVTGVRDPLDRLVLAAARATGSTLVSADAALDGFDVERVWA
jgi:PIN domain nuclease of toxin-antitoxin system